MYLLLRYKLERTSWCCCFHASVTTAACHSNINNCPINNAWINLSSISHPTICVSNDPAPVRLAYDYDTPSASIPRTTRKLWPAHAHSFLCYSCSASNCPCIAGKLRLCLTPANDPALFAHGTNLTWNRPLYSITTNSGLCPLTKNSSTTAS
jgi:hypothetical protein